MSSEPTGRTTTADVPLDRVVDDADRVVATNVSEHMLERHTDDLDDRSAFEVWSDFDRVAL